MMVFWRASDVVCGRQDKPKRKRGKFQAGQLGQGNGKGPKFSLSSDTVRRRREEIEEWDASAAKSRAFQALRK